MTSFLVNRLFGRVYLLDFEIILLNLDFWRIYWITMLQCVKSVLHTHNSIRKACAQRKGSEECVSVVFFEQVPVRCIVHVCRSLRT